VSAPRVLIVDDEQAIRDLIHELLRTQNYAIEAAGGGTEALELLRKKAFDLAIVDRNMPGVSGIDVVKLIRLNPKLSKMKVLMCTASSVNKEVDEAFAAGANDYVLKPLNFPVLLGKVAKLLASA
jgi:two-component system, chemotaxis family, chemotaxis protein CheY